MRLVGVDLHTRDESIAMVDTTSGELQELRITHEGDSVERFYAALPAPATVAIESTGYAIWFHALMRRLGHTLLVGDAAKIRATVVRRTKTDRRDARHILTLVSEGRFPAIRIPDPDVRDLRALVAHRMRLVRIRTMVRNGVHAIALNYRLTAGVSLFTRRGLAQLDELALPPHTMRRRDESLELLAWLDSHLAALDRQIAVAAEANAEVVRLMTHPGTGPLTALASVLVLRPIDRFPTGKHVASYIGLAPAIASSVVLARRHGRALPRGSAVWRAASTSRRRPPLQETPEPGQHVDFSSLSAGMRGFIRPTIPVRSCRQCFAGCAVSAAQQTPSPAIKPRMNVVSVVRDLLSLTPERMSVSLKRTGAMSTSAHLLETLDGTEVRQHGGFPDDRAGMDAQHALFEDAKTGGDVPPAEERESGNHKEETYLKPLIHPRHSREEGEALQQQFLVWVLPCSQDGDAHDGNTRRDRRPDNLQCCLQVSTSPVCRVVGFRGVEQARGFEPQLSSTVFPYGGTD
jgi:transposase